MKIFGFKFWEPSVETVQDQIPEVKTVIPSTKKPALMKLVPDPVLKYHSSRYYGRGAFHPPEYDLSEIGRVEDTDSYVRQSFDKKVALMFKEGWDIVGPNRRVIMYLKTRLSQIARASSTPTQELFRQVGSALIRKSNAFLVKVRKTEASGGAVRRVPGRRGSLKPVAAYFIIPAEAMEFEASGNKIVKWRQKMPSGDYKEYDPINVIHFYYDRKEGFIFGTPSLIPVIDDIRALRKIEENIELLIYQHLFPLFQYKVGTEEMPAGLDENGDSEIAVLKREIQFMPTEGGIVTPERHEIKAIGAEGRALRAEGYLDHFKKRVFAGLAISAVDMGEGETANRATADNMSRNLIDSVKDFQQVAEIFLNEFVIAELLLESTFGPEVLDEDNRCYLKFKEIDIDQQIKREAHIVDQFNKHAVTWPELRERMGKEPILVPTPDEVQAGTDTPDKYPEWNNTFWKLFRLPELLVQSIDEPWSPAARAAAKDNSLPMTEGDNKQSSEEQKNHEVDIEKEKAKARQAAKPKPVAKKKDGYLANIYSQTRRDTISSMAASTHVDSDWIASMIRTQFQTSIDKLIADQMLGFYRGYMSRTTGMTPAYIDAAASARNVFSSRAERYISRLTEDIIRSIRRNLVQVDTVEGISRIRAIFDSFEYRTRFIEDVEQRKAYSLGMAKAMKHTGVTEAVSIPTNKDPCDKCLLRAKTPIILDYAVIEDLPPHHASCGCILTIPETSVSTKDEGADDPKGFVPDKQIATCPECSKTALLKKDTPDIYNCRACGHSFRVTRDEDVVPQGDK